MATKKKPLGKPLPEPTDEELDKLSTITSADLAGVDELAQVDPLLASLWNSEPDDD